MLINETLNPFFWWVFFSSHTAASERYAAQAAVIATQAKNKEVVIEWFAMVKYEGKEYSTIVVECVKKKSQGGKHRRKQWLSSGFEKQSMEYSECKASLGQDFKVGM